MLSVWTSIVWLKFDVEGVVLNERFCDPLIKSQAKLSYDHAQQILDEIKDIAECISSTEEEPTLIQQIKESWVLASKLRKTRFKRGALDMEMAGVKIRLNEDFIPIRIDKKDCL